MKRKPLTNDSKGTARYLEREAEGMHPNQLHREFVQNGIEAGASRVTIDGWRDPDTGYMLTRITDNGTGMTAGELESRLSTIHGGGKGSENYGIGARIASLPFNQAGVTFASRVSDGSEGMVKLIKYDGEYVVDVWATVDGPDEYVVEPDAGMLDRLEDGETGTAVILHGDGTGDTWTAAASNTVRTFLSGRYLELPEGTTVLVDQPGQSTRRIRTFGDSLVKHAETSGVLAFADIGGLSGSMRWWTLPDEATRHEARAEKFAWGGIGLVVDDEIFAYSRDYMGDFGLIYKSLKPRVAILITVDGARMDTKRASVTLPNGGRPTPWKQLGEWFAENTPDEIARFVQELKPASRGLDTDLARLLDQEWMEKLQPVKVSVRGAEGSPLTHGDQDVAGTASPDGSDYSSRTGAGKRGKRPRKAAKRGAGGRDLPGAERPQVVLPDVEFVDDDDVERPGIKWEPVRNIILVSKEFPPLVREVERCIESAGVPRQIAQRAVEDAYIVEFQALVIDAKAQMDGELADQMLTEAALYAKVLGMQALTERIRSFVRAVAKAA